MRHRQPQVAPSSPTSLVRTWSTLSPSRIPPVRSSCPLTGSDFNQDHVSHSCQQRRTGSPAKQGPIPDLRELPTPPQIEIHTRPLQPDHGPTAGSTTLHHDICRDFVSHMTQCCTPSHVNLGPNLLDRSLLRENNAASMAPSNASLRPRFIV